MTMIRRFIPILLMALTLLAAGSPVSARPVEHGTQAEVLDFLQHYHPPVMTDNDQRMDFTQLIRQLQGKRVVFVGEIHDRYDQHLAQLAILKALYQQDPKIAVGVEWFQQPFQPVLDSYLAGVIPETGMLKQTGYFHRWRYDYRMLRPIVEYAKTNRLPLVALNAPTEITSKVAVGGLDSLTPEERAQIPGRIEPPDTSYLQHLKEVFAQHSPSHGKFDNFAMVQRIWDETMAANVARFLQANPDSRMVVFAGSGHVSRRAGIPADLARHIPANEMAVIRCSDRRDAEPGDVDYFIPSALLSLPETGKLGVWLESLPDGVSIGKLVQGSAADEAGLRQGDRIAQLNQKPIGSMDDLLIQLAHYKPGERVQLVVERTAKMAKGYRQVSFMVVLQ